MFIPDTTDNAKTYELTFDRLARWVVLFVCVLALVVCLFISVILRNNEAMYGKDGYVEQMQTLKAENEQLRKELSQAKAKDSAGETAEEREEKTADRSDPPQENETAEDKPPGLLPINGIATVIKDPTSEAEDFPDRMVFLALRDSEVIAGAAGVVREIYEYEQRENEFSVALLLDHRNGYETVYLISGKPKIFVQKGMRVERGDVLARLSEDESIVGYDIMYGGTSLNPAELLDSGQE